MKKTIFITNDFGPRAGGIETFIIGLIERLPRNSVTVYTSRQEGSSTYDLDWKRNFGVTVIRDKSRILLPTPRVRRDVVRLVRGKDFNVACFGAATPLGVLASALRRNGIARVVSLTHGHEVWWAKLFPFNVAMKYVGNSVDSLSYLGDFTREAIGRSLSREARSRMVKIAPGIDTHHFKFSSDSLDLRRKLGLSEQKVLVSVGRLVHRKGQDRLIEALPKIRARVPNAHLLLIGQGPHREALEALAKKYEVADHVTFIGRVPYADLPLYFGVGDVFAMPSRSRFFGLEVEGLGIVYLEASSCGLPVIAGDSGGAPDAVIAGVTGLVVDGTNIPEIAEAAISLLSNAALAQKMGSAGRDWVVDKWSWEIWSKEFTTFLNL